MWNLFLLLENEAGVRRFLEQKYRAQGRERPEKAAFRAAQPLMFYVKQAREYYRAARMTDLFVRPLLTYYGMMTLSKALMLTVDPDYPANTAVMRHGVSTRKRKRADFRFFQDEVRVQREGLFPELARHWGWAELIGERWTMKDLFALIPELQDGYRQVFREESLYPVVVWPTASVGERGMPFFLEERILDRLHLTPRAFTHRLQAAGKGEAAFDWEEQADTHPSFRLFWHHPRVSHVDPWGEGFDHPFFREDAQGRYFFHPTDGSGLASCLPEIFVHYLLLFALSMLCRYEPPLWGEIIYGFASEERVLIEEFLQVTQRKFPNLVLNQLFEEKILLVRT